MSLKDKASKLDFGSLPGAQSPGPDKEGQQPAAVKTKTAPGFLLAHVNEARSGLLQENEDLKAKVADLSAAASQVEELRAELSEWDGAKATRLIDPKLIAPSEWANRDARNFSGQEFEQLREEIASCGGNVQPIKVRTVSRGDHFQYEIVFGHRRHRACLDLGLPVLCVIDNLSDEDLFIQMDRENRVRQDLSPWEQGVMYQRALKKGLFPSNRRLAEKLGIDLSLLGKALALANLPAEVVEAFSSPLELQFRWAKPLSDAVAADPQGIVKRALEAKNLGEGRRASEVFDLLTQPAKDKAALHEVAVSHGGRDVAKITLDKKGRATVSFAAGILHERHLSHLQKALASFLAKLR